MNKNNSESKVFLKKAENGRLTRIDSIEDSDYVRVPTNMYVDYADWERLVQAFKDLNDQCNMLRMSTLRNDEESVIISKQEYHGFLNCLRIIKDRSLQQIEKSKADDCGFSLKYSQYTIYDQTYPDLKAYRITKTTPVSLKIDPHTANFLIMNDMRSYYNYVDLTIPAESEYTESTIIKPIALLQAVVQSRDPSFKYDFYIENSEKGRKIKNLIDSHPGPIIFEIKGLSSNYGQGVYDVTYWATGVI